MAQVTITLRQRRIQERECAKTLEVRDDIAPLMKGDSRRLWIEHTLVPLLPHDGWSEWVTTSLDVEEIEPQES